MDRYTVEEFLGEGGVAMVYRVKHVHLESIHALKLLAVNDQETKRRLIDEGKSQANLRHPNVLAVTDAFLHNGQPCLIMEYVDGPSLYDLLEEYDPTLQEALELFRGILRGVDAAHRHGLVHRDLKPENVLLAQTDDGVVPKVADFGLVKVLAKGAAQRDTAGGTFLGTPQYMSPQQISDPASVDHRADMFSLGCLLFEMVCGEMPFAAENTYDALTRIMNDDYLPPESIRPDLPSHVVAAINGLLDHDVEKRTADCSILMDELYDGADQIRSASENTQEIERESVVALGPRAETIIRDHSTARPARRVRVPAVVSAMFVEPEGGDDQLSAAAERVWIGIIAFMSGMLGVIVGLYVARFVGLFPM